MLSYIVLLLCTLCALNSEIVGSMPIPLQKSACASDISNICFIDEPLKISDVYDSRICLWLNKEILSSECTKFLTVESPSIVELCFSEIQMYCSDVIPGYGAIHNCLASKLQDLTVKCANFLALENTDSQLNSSPSLFSEPVQPVSQLAQFLSDITYIVLMPFETIQSLKLSSAYMIWDPKGIEQKSEEGPTAFIVANLDDKADISEVDALTTRLWTSFSSMFSDMLSLPTQQSKEENSPADISIDEFNESVIDISEALREDDEPNTDDDSIYALIRSPALPNLRRAP